MKALVTGASSGIGYEIAKYLNKLGIDLIVVARRQERLEKLQKELNKKIKIICLDLSTLENNYKLYELVKEEDIDILINNAGFGLFGEFSKTDMDRELQMIDLNVKCVHVLSKLFLKDMINKNQGYILNVASSAAFVPGPLMATYYATKGYVLRLTEAIYYELKKNKSDINISCLCPGPVDTEFNDVAKVKFGFKPLNSKYVAKYAIDNMLKNKLIIIPGIGMKVNRLLSKIISDKMIMKVIYKNQKKKIV